MCHQNTIKNIKGKSKKMEKQKKIKNVKKIFFIKKSVNLRKSYKKGVYIVKLMELQ